MWLEKFSDGVLELDTPIGPRYLQPTILQRAYLIWTFRNFFSLPHQVLHPWQQRLIDRLCAQNRFVARSVAGMHERPVIGRVERRAPASVEILPARKHMATAQPDVSGENREVASA